MAADYIRYANQNATRSLPLNSRLVEAFQFLPELGLAMEVFSGGQPAKGTSSRRVGSVRHDHGNSADVFFSKDGQRLDWANPEHRPIFGDIVSRAKAAGVTGFGAGPGYMQPGSMHVGFGNPGVWGAGGRGANAPDWLKAAYNGAPASVVSQMQASAQPSAAPARVGPQAPGTPAPAMALGRSIGNAPVMAAGPGPQPPQAVFGDLIAPQAPQSFANVIDSYAQRRRAEEEEHAARQARLAALFDMFPA